MKQNPITRGAFALSSIALAALGVAAEPKQFDGRLHHSNVAMDTELLNRAPQPASVQEFFADARKAFEDNPKARFADLAQIRQSAEKHGFTHSGGPLLGDLSHDGVRIWVRTLKPAQVTVLVQTPDGERSFGPTPSTAESDFTAVVTVSGLSSGTHYAYRVLVDGKPISMPANAVIPRHPEMAPRHPCGGRPRRQ